VRRAGPRSIATSPTSSRRPTASSRWRSRGAQRSACRRTPSRRRRASCSRARIQGARTILELGTLGGYSTIWLARALPAGGRLISLEADQRYAEVALANVERAGLSGVVEVRVGPALETLPQLAAERRGPFDLIFIDADKGSNPDYLAWALRLSRPGTVIVADNVVRGGTVIDTASDDPSVGGIRRFNELLASEPRVSATVIQTVGVKGYDGFALALVDQPA
jgi:predicted O-methyltransferase YrrM